MFEFTKKGTSFIAPAVIAALNKSLGEENYRYLSSPFKFFLGGDSAPKLTQQDILCPFLFSFAVSLLSIMPNLVYFSHRMILISAILGEVAIGLPFFFLVDVDRGVKLAKSMDDAEHVVRAEMPDELEIVSIRSDDLLARAESKNSVVVMNRTSCSRLPISFEGGENVSPETIEMARMSFEIRRSISQNTNLSLK